MATLVTERIQTGSLQATPPVFGMPKLAKLSMKPKSASLLPDCSIRTAMPSAITCSAPI